MSERKSSKFGVLEIGRGFAASLVVFHHSANMVAQERFYGQTPYGGHLSNFYVGVDFFFVLSGFIIAWVHWDDIGRSGRLGNYAAKRFLRIYPPYWGILIPLIAMYFLFPGSGLESQREPLNIVVSMLLLPYDKAPVLGVAWTLVHEIFFYLIFALIIVVGRIGLWLLPLWAAAIVVGAIVGVESWPLGFLLRSFNIEFIFGVAAAALLKHRTIPVPKLFALGGAVAFVALTLFALNVQDVSLIGRLCFGLSATAFVLGVVEMERAHPIRLPAFLAFFAASSYAVYLVHPVALSFAIQVVTRVFQQSIPIEIAVILLAFCGIAAGFFYHRWAEPTLTAIARRAMAWLNVMPARTPVERSI